MMKKIWKSTFALLMALTLLVSLAACGGSPASAPSGDAASQAAAPADDGKKPLTCPDHRGAQGRALHRP